MTLAPKVPEVIIEQNSYCYEGKTVQVFLPKLLFILNPEEENKSAFHLDTF